jgi:hypothetical protein
LEVISRDALLKSFIDAQGHFVPRELPDMRSFLELYLEDGRAMLPKDKLFAVLENSCFADTPARKSDAIDAINSSLVIVSYLLNSFEASANYYAMAEGWSILAACIARYVTKHAVRAVQWRESLDLVMAELDANLALDAEGGARPTGFSRRRHSRRRRCDAARAHDHRARRPCVPRTSFSRKHER